MKNNFDESLRMVLKHEGGFADHPSDPGGATMKGVTLGTFRHHYGKDRSKEDLKNISDDQLRHIYRVGYWDPCRCDDLPSGLDYAVFDSAVNSGPWRARLWLQGAVGAHMDGSIGPQTMACVEAADTKEAIKHLLIEERLKFLKRLDNWAVFGRGWEKRIYDVRVAAINMVSPDE